MKKNCFCKILITLKKNFYDVFHYNNFTAKLFSTIKGRIKKKNIPPFDLFHQKSSYLFFPEL